MNVLIKKSISFIVVFIFFALIAEQVYADQFTYVKFQKSYKVTKKIYYVHIIKMGNRLKGAKKITLKSSNKNVVYVNSETATYDKVVFFSPIKKGKAVVTAKVTTSSGTKTYKFRIGVKTDPPAASSKKASTKKTVKKYTVKFDPNKGSVSKKSKSVNKGDKYGTLPTPKRDYYDFKGWYTKASGGEKVTAGSKLVKNADHTLYAHWNAKDYSITYKLNGGTNNSKNKNKFTVETSAVTLYSPERSGYDFGGWYTDSELKTEITKIKKGTHKNIVVYAKWLKAFYIDDLSDITKDNAPTVTSAIFEGTIKGAWYNKKLVYKFIIDTAVVYSPASFFQQAKSNRTEIPQYAHSFLNERINEGKGNGYVYYALREDDGPVQRRTDNGAFTYNTYYSTFCRFEHYFVRSPGEITSGIKLMNAVAFQCDDKVYYIGSNDESKAHAPETEEEMARSIRRLKASVNIVPSLKATLNNPGSEKWYMNYYKLNGYGSIVPENPDIYELLKLGSYIEPVVSIITKPLSVDSLKALYKLSTFRASDYFGKETGELKGKSREQISKNDRYVYQCDCTSPVTLSNDGDYIESEIWFWSDLTEENFVATNKDLVMEFTL